MKFLLVLLVIVVAVWIWRQNRREALRDAAARAQPRAVPGPQAMTRCAHCGLHLPAADAVTDASGSPYCSAEHRQAAQG